MLYLLCQHKVADFARWHQVFKSHTEAQEQAGLHLFYLLRDAADLNYVVILFKVDDLKKAKAFTESPDAGKAAQNSGVIGVPKISFLRDS